jgi:hypothetical protein
MSYDLTACLEAKEVNLAAMKTAVETALKAVGLEKPVTLEEEDCYVSIDGVVSVSPCRVETKGILGVKMVDGWLVEWWSETPATRDDPPDVVGRDIYRGVNAYDAARKAALSFHEEALTWCFGESA